MTAPQISTDEDHECSFRTRAAIPAARHRLNANGEPSPTTTRIVEAAGVGPRTCFAPLPGREGLSAATADDVHEEIYRHLTAYSLTIRPRGQSSAALREEPGLGAEAVRRTTRHGLLVLLDTLR